MEPHIYPVETDGNMPDDEGGKLILRDMLAVHRTTLANERTFLAYVRTGFTLFIAGVTFIKFFDNPLLAVTGWILVPVSVVTLVRGVISYREMGRMILEDEHTATEKVHRH